MGMSASQARLLSLQARQSNLEYQGQQINQERTILSQQATALYNSLLAMDVPTPPSTQDYTTIQYSGTDGATTFTLGTIKPSGENYNVEIQQTATGNAITANYGSSVVGHAGADMRGEFIDITMPVGTNTYSQLQDGQDEYIEGDIYISETPIYGSELIEQGENPDDWKDAGSQLTASVSKLSIYKSHTLKIRGYFVEDDTTGDDTNNGSITLYYSPSDSMWRLDSTSGTEIGSGDTFIFKAGSSGEGVRAQFRFEWQ